MDTPQKAGELGQYLTFELAGQGYALDLMHVREIVEYGALTKVPRTPAAIRGVVNLRGNVMPVVDLGLIFGLKSGPITTRTCIIVVETIYEGERGVMGVMADAVSKVTQWPSAELLPPPAFGMRVRVDFIKGMAKAAEKFVILLDINRVLSNVELNANAALREL